MKYLTKSIKTDTVAALIDDAIDILCSVGIPLEGKTERALEKMGMAFLAVAGITSSWEQATSIEDQRFVKTREIIAFINMHFQEKISSGSYDDIRRKDLKLLILAGLVVNSADNVTAATNDPTRGYSITNEFKRLLLSFSTPQWFDMLTIFNSSHKQLREEFLRIRNIEKVSVTLPDGTMLDLSQGLHNDLQKAVIEEFLPRYGYGSQLLYLGDTAEKMLFLQKDKLEELHFFELSHDKLPDIIAYSSKKNWLFLIEAVHSSGAINETRLLELRRLTEHCTAEIIYVTAFLTRNDFRKWSYSIAWETEVWIAENPDHLIHFNGDKFLGPYQHSARLVR